MRKAFIDELIESAKEDEDIWLLTADLGYSFLEKFQQAFPDRFINVGVAEQNMISIAAGLALCGKKVFVYSIINFLIFRALEQIRNDVCYHNLAVCMVGVGAGYSYRAAGYSHYGVEDVGVTKGLLNLNIYSPVDPIQTKEVIEFFLKEKRPTYMRLGKNSEPLALPALFGSAKSGYVYHDSGEETVLFCLGDVLFDVIKFAQNKEGLACKIILLSKVYPLEDEMILEHVKKAKKIATLEIHASSGLFSIVSEILVSHQIRTPFFSFFMRQLEDEPLDLKESIERFIEQL